MSAGDSIRILAVDDDPIFRVGLAMVLATQPDMNLVAQASNGREAIQYFCQHHPDITLMDLQMPATASKRWSRFATNFPKQKSLS